MTENQFYILITTIGAGLGMVATAIRFSVSRIITALDTNSRAMLENTKSNAVLSTKIDNIADFVHDNTPRGMKQRPKTNPKIVTTDEENEA